jgi:hypothetical protein
MSIRVDLATLASAIADHGPLAYVLSTGRDRPHVLHTAVELVDGRLTCPSSATLARNLAADAGVTVLWPPPSPGAMSLLVDAVAHCEDERVVMEPVSAILHVARA